MEFTARNLQLSKLPKKINLGFFISIHITAQLCLSAFYSSYAQKTYYLHIDQPEAVVAPILIDAGVNDSLKNELVWEYKGITPPEFFKIYRSNSLEFEDWKLIDTVNYTDQAQFIDTLSDPFKKAYAYTITSVNQCGGETEKSVFYQSIELKCSNKNADTYTLNWEQVEEFNITQYNVLRGVKPDSLTPIATITDNVFSLSDTPPYPDNTYYQIEAVKKNNAGSYPQLKCLSNLVSTREINIEIELGLQFYPNPFCEILYLRFPNFEKSSYQITLWNVYGKEIQHLIVSNGNAEIERGNLTSGVYLLQVKGTRNYKGKVEVR